MKLTPYWLIAASFIGIADTAYLIYEKLHGTTPGCLILNGCEQVLNSPYSNFLGVPLAFWGFVFYLYMLAVAILLAIDPESKGLRIGILIYTAIGLLLSIGFELFQYFVIEAMCLYCAISAGTAALLFALAAWHYLSYRRR